MAELNLNYDLPWLQQKPDSNQPMSLAEAFQLQQQKKQQDALLPLRQQQLQAEIANAALDRQITQEKMGAMLKTKATDAAVWEQASTVSDWLDPEQVTPIYKAIAVSGGSVSPQTLAFLEKSVQGAQMFSARTEKLENDLAIANAKLSMPQKETALEDTIQNQLRDENASRKAQGQPEMTTGEAAEFKKALRAQSNILGGGREATQVFDVNGNLMFSQTKGGGMPQGTTPGLQTTAQKDILTNKKAFDIAHDLESSLDPSSVGAVGVISNAVFDKALAQIDPSLANNKRIDDRTKLITARNQIVRLINSDSRFSALDRQEAEQALPSPGVVESYPDIQQKLKTLQQVFKRRSYQDSISQGVPPPYWSMPDAKSVKAMFQKKKSEVLQAIQEGKMSKAKGNAMILREQADAEETLLEQFNFQQ